MEVSWELSTAIGVRSDEVVLLLHQPTGTLVLSCCNINYTHTLRLTSSNRTNRNKERRTTAAAAAVVSRRTLYDKGRPNIPILSRTTQTTHNQKYHESM